jgi:AcrR family transcriptional regulator
VARANVEARRAEILETTCQVVIDRGFGATRVSDVAERLGVSTGLIHYHFESKDHLLAEAFQWAANADLARLAEEVDKGGSATACLERIFRLYGHVESEPGWMLWIDGWGEALRNPAVRHISEELDLHWQQVIERLVLVGAAADEFRCADARATAWRLTALLDGLGLQVTVHEGMLSRGELLEWVRVAAAADLGMDPSAFAASVRDGADADRPTAGEGAPL